MSRLSPVNQARWARFRHNRRGYWSLWIFAVLFALSMCSELIANDKPLLVHFKDRWYVPVLTTYSESDFGGPFATPAEYQDPGYVNRSRSTAGLSGRRFVLARTVLTSPRPPPSLRRLPRKTGWERTPTAAMCWRAFSMAPASRSCLGYC